jgi:hypothetical protein
MSDTKKIPLFPLAILPLPGELVPLHIFEPRYKQLLQDAETRDIRFGIFYNDPINESKIGSVMKLESVIKRYSSGESDIIVKCNDIFYLDTLYKNFRAKMYPGGQVQFWNVNLNEMAGGKLGTLFLEYLNQRNITRRPDFFSAYQIAQELSLTSKERYNFLNLEGGRREHFLLKQIKLQRHVLTQVEKTKDTYHLN